MRIAAMAALLAVAHGSTAFSAYGDRSLSGREDAGRAGPSGRGGGGIIDVTHPSWRGGGIWSTPGGHDSASTPAGRGSATTGGGGWGPSSSRERSGDY